MFPTRLKDLRLTNFRCYNALKLIFEEQIIVFTGPNGAGKTNILEAISFLNPGRGLRRAKLMDLKKQNSFQNEEQVDGSLGWVVSGRLNLRCGESQIGTAFIPPSGEGEKEKRLIRIDEKELSTQAELEKALSIIWMTPVMDRLLSEGASSRRRLLDKFISSLDPEHSKRLYRYEYALRERTQLLKEGKMNPIWLNALEEKMALEGVALTVSRQEMVTLLQESMKVHTSVFPKPLLFLEGVVETLLTSHSALEVEERVKKMLQEMRSQDRLMGGTSLGPHVSDLKVIHENKNISLSLCSTGEQKILLISLILAHLRIHSVRRKETPLLLLDEGLVHLDKNIRYALFEEIKNFNVQTFLTGTDPAPFIEIKEKIQFFDIVDGNVFKP